MKILDTFTAILDVLIVVVIYIENYLFWENSNVSTNVCSYLRALAMLSSGAVIICIIIHYSYKLNVIKYRDNRVEENVTLVSTGLWKFLLIEILINSLVCPPSVDFTFTMTSVGNSLVYSFDALTSFFALFRIYSVLRLFEHYSHWTNERSKRVCKINGA